jgi:hypothetical protein
MATARDLIRTNTAPQSGLIFNADFDASSFTPKGWSKYHNYSTQKQEITAINSTANAVGTTLEFRPAKNADYYGFLCLQTPFSLITAGTGFTYYRLCDYAGVFAVNNIKVSHVSNLLTQLDMNIYLPKYLKDSDPKKRYHYDPLLLGNLSPSVRNNLARGSQVALTPLDGYFWFTYSTSSFIPVVILSHELRFEVTYNAVTQFIESDHTSGTPTCTITPVTIKGVTYNPALVFLTGHVTGDERSWQIALFEKEGVMAPFKEYKSQPRTTVLAGSSGVIPIRLTSLKDQISELYFIIRRQSDVQTNYANNLTRTLTYVSCNFVGNGGEMVASHTKEYIDRRIREQYHSSWCPENYHIGVISFSWIPEDPVNNTGSVHLGVISDPILNINVGTSAGQSSAYDVLNGTGPDTLTQENIVVDVFVDVFNWLHYVGGDINKTFN